MIKLKYFIKKLYLSIRGVVISILVRSGKKIACDACAVRSILVVRIDRIGDVVLSLPAIKKLHEIFPKARISLLVRPYIIPLLENVPYINELIPYQNFLSSLRFVRRKKFDMTVDLLMDYSIKTALFSFLSAAGIRAGFDIENRGRFFNIPVVSDIKDKHMSEHILDIIREIGLRYDAAYRIGPLEAPRLTIAQSVRDRAEDILKSGGVKKGDRLVCIHPGGNFPSQRWMPESFAELADRLSEKLGAKIIIIGSASERKLVEGIVSIMKAKPIFAIGKSMDVVSGIIASSDLMICNNSGPLHIACALGTPTVSTMGPTVFHLWRPLGDSNIVISRQLSCSPCSEGSCSGHECMKRISVDEMESAASSLLKRDRSSSPESVQDRTRKGSISRIIVINLGGIGDAILSTPALRSLKHCNPQAMIYFLGIRRVNDFIRRLDYIEKAVDFDLGISMKAIFNNIRSLMYLRGLKADLALNMRTVISRKSAFKMNLLLKIIGAGFTAGRDTDGLGGYFDIKIPESPRGDKSEMEYDLDLVRALGCEIISVHPDFPVKKENTAKILSLLASQGVSERDILVGIHPGGKLSHRWPAEKFCAMMNSLGNRVKVKFVITGDGTDLSVAKEVMARSPSDTVNAAGILDIEELGALIKRCNLYICNDTAAMHIASALNVPLIAIFGPGYLRRFDPRRISKNAKVIVKQASCAPCDRSQCQSMECMNNIGIDEVIDAAIGMLRQYDDKTV